MDLIEFVKPYYESKDIMHNLSHIRRVLDTVDFLIDKGSYSIDKNLVLYAAYFHGFIYMDEEAIRTYLYNENFTDQQIETIIKISYESQKKEIPSSLEAKVLHDAHMIEGGKTYLFVKSLITGSVRGQTLEETIKYMEENVLNKGECYLDEAIKIYSAEQQFLKDALLDLKDGLFITQATKE